MSKFQTLLNNLSLTNTTLPEHEKNILLSDPEFIEYCKTEKNWDYSEHDYLLKLLDLPMNEEGYRLDAFGNRISFMGNRTVKRTNTKLNLNKIHENEIKKCSEDFTYFRKYYVKIVTNHGIDRPDIRDYQSRLETDLLENSELAVSFPRQSGKTVVSGNYLLWESIFRNDIIVGIAAQKAGTAREVLSKMRQSFTLLPMWLMPGVSVFNKGRIDFENGSKILTDSTNIDSFRGYSCNIIFCDECLSKETHIKVRSKNTGKIENIAIGVLFNIIDNFSDNPFSIFHQEKTFYFDGEIKINDEYEVLTHKGWKNFQAIKRVSRNEAFTITLSNNTSFTATSSHRLCVGTSNAGKIFRTFEKLKVGDKISNFTIMSKEKQSGEDYFYDIMGVEDTQSFLLENDIISHNCAYIRPSVWKEFTDAILPTQAALSFTKTIFASTANGYNHWYHIVQKAKNNKNKHGWKLSECSWKEVPRFDKKGKPISHEEFKEKEIAKNGLIYWNQAHENQFLGSSNTLISSDALRRFVSEEPIIIGRLFNGLRIFEEPKDGKRYILAVDPAKEGIDKIGIQVMDISQFPFTQVATADLDDSYISMPGKIFDLGMYYNKALVVVENNIDQSIVDSLYMNYEYPDVYKERNKKVRGFRTTTKTKRLMLSNLKKFVDEDKLIIKDEKTIDQLFTFIDNGKGSFAAEEGAFDDLVMSLALCFAPFLEIMNFDDFKDFLSKLEKKKTEETEKEDEILNTLSFGFVDMGEEVPQFQEGTIYYNPFLSEFRT